MGTGFSQQDSCKKHSKFISTAIWIFFIPVIQQGIETGEFRHADAQEVAIAIGAIMEGTILLWVYDKSMVDPEQHIRSGMKLLLEGVKALS